MTPSPGPSMMDTCASPGTQTSLRRTRSYAESREQLPRERLQFPQSTGSKVSVVWEWRNSSHHQRP